MIEQGDYKDAVSHLTAAVETTKACTVPKNGAGEGSDEYRVCITFSLDALISKSALRDASGDDGYLSVTVVSPLSSLKS